MYWISRMADVPPVRINFAVSSKPLKSVSGSVQSMYAPAGTGIPTVAVGAVELADHRMSALVTAIRACRGVKPVGMVRATPPAVASTVNCWLPLTFSATSAISSHLLFCPAVGLQVGYGGS